MSTPAAMATHDASSPRGFYSAEADEDRVWSRERPELEKPPGRFRAADLAGKIPRPESRCSSGTVWSHARASCVSAAGIGAGSSSNASSSRRVRLLGALPGGALAAARVRRVRRGGRGVAPRRLRVGARGISHPGAGRPRDEEDRDAARGGDGEEGQGGEGPASGRGAHGSRAPPRRRSAHAPRSSRLRSRGSTRSSTRRTRVTRRESHLHRLASRTAPMIPPPTGPIMSLHLGSSSAPSWARRSRSTRDLEGGTGR